MDNLIPSVLPQGIGKPKGSFQLMPKQALRQFSNVL